jgi:polysaccharide pyruvyl transferase WcaK-like protein
MDNQIIKRIVLWGAWYGSKNVGDRALLLSITDLIGESDPNVHFTVLTANPENVHSLVQSDSKFKIKAIKTRGQFLRTIYTIAKSDLFIFGGGVPFFDRPLQIVAMLILILVVRFFDIPYFLWSVSSLPVQSRMAKAVFGWILLGASSITCRDEFTRQLFINCGVNPQNVTKTGDPALLLKTNSRESALELLNRAGWRSEGRRLVGLTPRTLRTADGEAETHYIPKTEDEFQAEINAYALVLDWLWEHGYQPIFIPMNTVVPDDDRVASKLVMSRARFGDSALLINEEIDPRTASAIYEHCQASFVSRLHGCIMSVKAHCPVIMYAFEQKHVGIMRELGLSDYIFYPMRSSSLRLIDMLSGILTDQIDVRNHISQCLEESGKKSLIPLEQVLQILRQNPL